MGIAPHAMDDERHIVKMGFTAGGEDVLSGSHTMCHERFAQVMSYLKMPHKYRCLYIQLGPTGAIHSSFADG